MNLAEVKTFSNANLTERQALITGSRWCMSCSKYRRADNGAERLVNAGNGVRKMLWKCAVCTARKNGRER